MAYLPIEMIVKLIDQTQMPTVLEVLTSVEDRFSEIARQDEPSAGELFDAFRDIHALVRFLELKKKLGETRDNV